MRGSQRVSKYVAQAVDALRSGFARDPNALRAYAVDLVTELADGDGGGWYELAMVEGEPLPGEHHTVGLPPSIFRQQLEERIPYPHADPRLPDPRWNRRFVLLRGVVADPERDLFPSRLYERCWRPARLCDQLRMTVHHAGEMVAWVGALRVEGSPMFGRAEARRLAPVAEALADALITARAMQRANEPETSADLLLTADGNIELCSDAAKSMLAEDGSRETLTAWVRAIDRGETPRVTSIAGRIPRWSRLTGPAGCRYLVHLESAAPVRVHPAFVLSPTQRRVGRLAAAGLTVPEIASAIAMRASTVRTHLRIAYAALDVSTRAELANALSEMPSERAPSGAR